MIMVWLSSFYYPSFFSLCVYGLTLIATIVPKTLIAKPTIILAGGTKSGCLGQNSAPEKWEEPSERRKSENEANSFGHKLSLSPWLALRHVLKPASSWTEYWAIAHCKLNCLSFSLTKAIACKSKYKRTK